MTHHCTETPCPICIRELTEGAASWRDVPIIHITPITDIAPDLFTASNLRDQAIAKLDAANGEEFGRRSRDFILAYLRCHGPTSGETLVIECKAAGIIPVRDDRAFGGAFLSLSRKKLIVKVGDCKRARGHSGNGGVVWAIRNS